MKLFDKKAERTVWLSILASIPLLLLVLWKYRGKLGLNEIIIVCLVLLLSIGLLYGIKWYSNKE